MTETGTTSDDALDLTQQEAALLAMRLIVRHLMTDTEWVQWEDVPYLSESGFLRLDSALGNAAKNIESLLRTHEQGMGIDTAHLLEQATYGVTREWGD